MSTTGQLQRGSKASPLAGVGMQSHAVAKYSFETVFHTSRRKGTDAEKYLEKMFVNLSVDAERATAMSHAIGPILLAMIAHHHLNIEWYESAIKRQRILQGLFFLLSAILLLVIPVAIPFTMLKILGTATATTGGFGATVVSAVIAGVLGFQRALGVLLEKRSMVAIFHRASAALKRQVFEFEDRWAGCVPSVDDEAELEAFKTSLRDSIRRARDIEELEQQQFFDRLEGSPSINVGEFATQAAGAASSLVTSFVPHSNLLAARKIPDLQQRIELLKAKLEMLDDNLARATNETQRRIIENERLACSEELRAAQQALRASVANRT